MNYEIMCILDPTLDEETTQKELENFENILKQNKVESVEFDKWGLRELAYEIKKHNKGYYVILKVKTEDSKSIDEFDRLTRINKNVLRHLIIRKD